MLNYDVSVSNYVLTWKLVQMWTGFDLFYIWDIISSCVFSNHFWWFEISEHIKFIVVKKNLMQILFMHIVVCILLCVLGLDSYKFYKWVVSQP
jgi:hypothetical protein